MDKNATLVGPLPAQGKCTGTCKVAGSVDELANTKWALDKIREELTRLRMERTATTGVVESIKSLVGTGVGIHTTEALGNMVGQIQLRVWQLESHIPKMEREFGRLERELVRLTTEQEQERAQEQEERI